VAFVATRPWASTSTPSPANPAKRFSGGTPTKRKASPALVSIRPVWPGVSIRNFLCHTLKIKKVPLVVMGSYDMPCGRSAPGRPIGRPGSSRPQGVIGVFLVTYLKICN
jgi:hypothetical protein